MADAILRLPEVKQRCGRSRTQIYAAIQRGEFPSQVRLGPRSVGWLESTINAWIAARPKKINSQATHSSATCAKDAHHA
jgi:prophage regulatory protein